jgi:hypothetical protein
MRKIQILGAFAAVLAFSALAVASASATLWLKAGASLSAETAANTHGILILHHTGGLAGSLLIECDGLFVGKVGPGALDLVELVENLSGTEQDLISCKVTSGNIFCPTGTLVSVHAVGLPWHTLLVLEAGVTFDEFLTGGYEVLCNGNKVECKGANKAKFIKNAANGAEFEFQGTIKNGCNDPGGEGTILGKGEVLGFTVS